MLGLLTAPAHAGRQLAGQRRSGAARRFSAAHNWLRTARRGYCEETEFDSGASCARGRKGAWKLKAANIANATATCLALCGGCPRCRYISVTASECNWFKNCDLEALGRQVSFRSGFFPGRLNSSQDGDGDEDDAPWSLQAAARSRSDDWGAARRIFSPLVASARRVGRGPIGIGAHFGTLKEGYWSYLQITLRAWRERANASLVILTDQADVLRGRLGQAEGTAGDLRFGLRGLARREQGWGALTEVIVQPVNVTRMSSSWGVVKELQGATTFTRSPNYTLTICALHAGPLTIPTPSPYALHCVQNLSHTPFLRTRQRCSPVHHAQAPTRSGTAICYSAASCASPACDRAGCCSST